MTSEERRQYVREVCLALVGKEPEDYRMSVAEFGVLQQWMDGVQMHPEDEELTPVPLRVVLQTIDEIRQRDGRTKHFGVLYLKSAVEAEMRRRDRALA